MKIGVDIDGVLADFVSAHSAVLFNQTGIKLPPVSDEWPDVWDYDKAAGFTSAQRSAFWEEVKTTSFWASLLPLEGALEAIARLNELQGDGHEVYYITSRPGHKVKHLTEVWLRWHGAENPTVIISNDKGSIAKGLELEVMIEDKPENLVDVARATYVPNSHCRLYLTDRPYNRGLTALGVAGVGYHRVPSINEALDIEFPRQEAKAA